MNSLAGGIIDVFPISTTAFGFRADWFETDVPKLIQPAYLLMVLFLVISVGIMVLKRFQNAELEKKLWNLPVIITLVAIWPILITGLKGLIDSFNTFLVQDIFQISWKGFGFPDVGSVTNIVGWSAEGLARLLPNFSYWIVYAFYIVFFFFFVVLGPLILAKGILFDEIEAFLELIKEIALLFLWQTTLVILVAFIMPDIVSGKPFPSQPEENIYFLSLILGVMILFVPTMTRKFGNHLGSSIFPPGFRYMGMLLGISAFGKMGSAVFSDLGVSIPAHKWNMWTHRSVAAIEVGKRHRRQNEFVNLKYENKKIFHELQNSENEHDEQLKRIGLEEDDLRDNYNQRDTLNPENDYKNIVHNKFSKNTHGRNAYSEDSHSLLSRFNNQGNYRERVIRNNMQDKIDPFIRLTRRAKIEMKHSDDDKERND